MNSVPRSPLVPCGTLSMFIKDHNGSSIRCIPKCKVDRFIVKADFSHIVIEDGCRSLAQRPCILPTKLTGLLARRQKTHLNQRMLNELTYSFGNSPNANEQSNDVFPHAPIIQSSQPYRDVNENGLFLPSPTMTSFRFI